MCSSRRIEKCPQSGWGCMGGGATDHHLEDHLIPGPAVAVTFFNKSKTYSNSATVALLYRVHTVPRLYPSLYRVALQSSRVLLDTPILAGIVLPGVYGDGVLDIL